MPKLNSVVLKYQPLKRINNFWLDLIGDPSVFPLESRIFHSISIGMIFLTLIYTPYNLYAGLYIASASAAILGALYAFQFYSSRFCGRRHSSMLFGVTGILIFGFNYFANSGIDGSTDLIWPAHLLLVLAISPYQQHTRWMFAYLFCFVVLHALEYYYPSWVQHPFTAGRGQFIDRVTAFPLPVFAIYLIIRFIRRSYDAERMATEEKKIAIEVSKAQIQLQKDQLEQSNIEKSKLMSIISHDLRTPLMNIQNYLELLRESQVAHEERDALEQALLKATNNATEMLSNLLHWSKSQMDGPQVNLQQIGLLKALTGTLEMEKLHAVKKNILMEYDLPAELNIIADVDMLQLVVRNLISNAVKFTPQSGKITVSVERLPAECKIMVQDNGKGIPEDKQDQIFSIKSEPDYGTNNERGVGLGLVLCKEYIERQGGRIGFESKYGVGSTFFIFIPLHASSADPASQG